MLASPPQAMAADMGSWPKRDEQAAFNRGWVGAFLPKSVGGERAPALSPSKDGSARRPPFLA